MRLYKPCESVKKWAECRKEGHSAAICPAHIDYFRSSFAGKAPVYLFTLWAPLEVVVARELERPGRAKLGHRVHEGYTELEENLDRMGHVVPNVEQDIRAVAERIHEFVLTGVGRLAP